MLRGWLRAIKLELWGGAIPGRGQSQDTEADMPHVAELLGRDLDLSCWGRKRKSARQKGGTRGSEAKG